MSNKEIELDPTTIVSFEQIANDLSKLNYDKSNIIDGKILIGDLMAADNSVCRWEIIEKKFGFVISITPVYEGIDDKGNYIASEKSESLYMLPCADLFSRNDNCTFPTTFNNIAFTTVDEAFDTFLEIVYTSERTETYNAVKSCAKTILNDYIDPFNSNFNEFKKAFLNTSCFTNNIYVQTRISTAMLLIRYPFLIPCKLDNIAEQFEWSLFETIPSGWAKRFGLELCEDLRNQAYDQDERIWTWRLCNMKPNDIKEKFGELRWYGTSYGRGQDIIDVYENISSNVCINCGSADKTRITNGWITPLCWDELNIANTNEEHNVAEEMYLTDVQKQDFQKRYASWKLNDYKRAISTTNPAMSATELQKILENFNCQMKHSHEETKTLNQIVCILDGSLAPNGEPIWARKVIQDICEEIEKRENNEHYDIQQYVDELEVDIVLPKWFSKNHK